MFLQASRTGAAAGKRSATTGTALTSSVQGTCSSTTTTSSRRRPLQAAVYHSSSSWSHARTRYSNTYPSRQANDSRSATATDAHVPPLLHSSVTAPIHHPPLHPPHQQVRWLRPPTNVPPAYRPYDSDDEYDNDEGGGYRTKRSSRGGNRRGGSGGDPPSSRGGRHRPRGNVRGGGRGHGGRGGRGNAAARGGRGRGSTGGGTGGGNRRSKFLSANMRDVGELRSLEASLESVLHRYEGELRSSYVNGGDGAGPESVVFQDLDTVQRKREEDAERRRNGVGTMDASGSPNNDKDGNQDKVDTPSAPPAATIAAIQSTEADYKEAATLLRKLVSGWSSVRIYSHADQLDRSMLPKGNGGGAGRDKNSPAHRALEFLNQLEDLRVERTEAIDAAIGRAARERADAEAARKKGGVMGSGSFLGSVGYLFGFGGPSVDNAEDDKSVNAFALDSNDLEGVAAHTSPEYAAERHLYRQVMKSSIHWYRAAQDRLDEQEDNDSEDDLGTEEEKEGGPPVTEMSLGQHLSNILEKMEKRARAGNPNVWPNAELYLIVLKIFSFVGTLPSANSAYRLLRKVEISLGHNSSGLKTIEEGSEERLRLYHTVILAYRNAAGHSSKRNAQKAFKKAEGIIAQDLKNAARRQRKNERQDRGVKAVPNTVTYNLLLDTLNRAGHSKIPDICDQADAVAEQMVGRDKFLVLVGESKDDEIASGASDESKDHAKAQELYVDPDQFTKHLLLTIYSGKPDNRKYVERTKALMASMENHQNSPGSRVRSDDGFVQNLPSRDTYNAVLRGLLHLNEGSEQIIAPNTSNRSSRSLFQGLSDAEYATELLDNMSRYESCQPSKFSFNYVLRLWAQSGNPEAGLRAQDILSRMEVRAVICGGQGPSCRLSAAEIPKPDALCYQNAIACWGVSAAMMYPGAASSASMLLEKMVGQCNPGGLSFEPGDERNNLLDQIYEESVRPNRYVYTTLIMCCACTQLETDKADALRIAFDAYNSMVEAGINPTYDTYSNLLKVCKNLMPVESPEQRDQRNNLSRNVFEAAQEHGQVNAQVLISLREVNPVLYESQQEGMQ